MTLLGASQLETNLREKRPGGLGAVELVEVGKDSAVHPCTREEQPYTGLYLRIQDSNYFPVFRACKSKVPVYWGATNQWQTYGCPVYDTNMVKELEHMMQDRLRELSLSSLKKRRLLVCVWCITAAHSHPWGGCREDGARIFSKAHTDIARDNRQVSTGRLLVMCDEKSFHWVQQGWEVWISLRYSELNKLLSSLICLGWLWTGIGQDSLLQPCIIQCIVTAGCSLPACLTQEREPYSEYWPAISGLFNSSGMSFSALSFWTEKWYHLNYVNSSNCVNGRDN